MGAGEADSRDRLVDSTRGYSGTHGVFGFSGMQACSSPTRSLRRGHERVVGRERGGDAEERGHDGDRPGGVGGGVELAGVVLVTEAEGD